MPFPLRALAVAVLVSLGAPAAAQPSYSPVDVVLQVKPRDPANPRERDKAPEIEATIIGGQKTTLDRLTLTTMDGDERVTMRATKIREYAEGSETIAIALVICGQEIWIGNDEYEPDPNARYEGTLKNLAQAIDRLQLGSAGPPGSRGLVVSYSTGAEIKLPMGDLTAISGGALGSQRDYRGKIGTDMVQGITMAMAELSKVATSRKALIVVGDGNDTNNEVAKTALAQLAKDAARANIQMFGIIYKSIISSPGSVITTMIPNATVVNSIDGIASELNAILARMADRFYVTFAGHDERTNAHLPWDGADHALAVVNGTVEYEPVVLQLAPRWSLPSPRSFNWLAVIVAACGLVLFVLVLPRPRARPAPTAALPLPARVVAPPSPAVPSKTVMLSANADHDGFPVVGWLVALNGRDIYKTLRLKAGLTKIGTSAPADIVINDGFMSTKHCEITCSPGGFALVDSGATNGCYVNDRRVAHPHQLVDNDVITLGMTNFRFKSIN